MSRKTKKIIITLGILVLLGAAYYGSVAYTNWQRTTAFPPFTPQPRLGNMEWFELVKIEIPGLTLERRDEIWELAYLEGGIPPDIMLDQRQIQMMLFPLSNMWIDRTVDEAPEDISIYGLDEPSSRVILTDSTGRIVEYIRGELTPSMIHYYVMQKGDPAVYAVSEYHGGLMHFTLDSIRQRLVFPPFFDITDLTQMRLETPGTRIEIIEMPESVPPHLSFTFTDYLLTSPYAVPRGVLAEPLGDLLIPFSGLMIEDFIDDNPLSLRPYGLDQATRVFLQIGARSLDLLIGNEVDGMHYAKLTDGGGVFTLSGMESVVNARPFPLIVKFPILINIDTVDRLTVSGGERPLTATIEGTGRDAVFFLNGRKAEERSFRIFYQAVIGLIVDAEYSGSAVPPQNSGEITIELLLNSPAEERVHITLIPYNRDFYILRQDGVTEFLISRNQVRRIFETADAVVFE